MEQQITRNKRITVGLTFFIFGVFATFAAIVGLLTDQLLITPFVLAGGLIYLGLIYWRGTKMVLRFHKAQPIAKKDDPTLYRLVENLAIRVGIPRPKIYLIPDPAPNAFATGLSPESAVIGVTTGLREMLDKDELEGVLAHEMGHIVNYDVRVSLINFGVVGIFAIIVDLMVWSFWGNSRDRNGAQFLILLAALVGLVVVKLVSFWVSRKREYLADTTGSSLTQHPDGLASALEKIGQAGSGLRRGRQSTAHLFFANPIPKSLLGSGFLRLFSTHPPIEQRIARLRKMTDLGF